MRERSEPPTSRHVRAFERAATERPSRRLRRAQSPGGHAEGTAGSSARRLAASGISSARAVARASAPQAGPGRRWGDWRQLEAARFGMPAVLLSLLQQPDVTDVLVNGTQVWVDRGTGLEAVPLELGEGDRSRALAVRMAAAAGKRLDDASPVVDGVLGGSFRLHAVLPPVSRGGASISLRVVRSEPFTMQRLVEAGSVHPGIAERLREAVEEQQSILFCGGTGTGKTTLLATLLGMVPSSQRIVCIEEVSELAIDHPHVVQLQARAPNVEGEGAVGLDELVRAAVRMRPDRVVLGECRGSEVREVLTAMNTGHRGSCATIHSNSVQDVPARLIALGALGGLEPQAVAALAAPAFDLLVHLERDSSGRRFVSELGRMTVLDGRLQGVTTERVDGQGNCVTLGKPGSDGTRPNVPGDRRVLGPQRSAEPGTGGRGG